MLRHLHVKDILMFGIESVKPESLVKRCVQPLGNDKLIVNKTEYSLSNNVFIIGFGKAVAGMCGALEPIIGSHFKKGIISIPFDTKHYYTDLNPLGKVTCHEAAINNLPDTNALEAAKSIYNLVSSLSPSDILFILISGGGSALLPYPRDPLTLEDKITVTKLLASRGATIQELNTVRKRLSMVKGGGLGRIAKCQTVTLILSDIINDPLDLIASSPTLRNKDDKSLPLLILEKYNLFFEVPNTVVNVLSNINDDESHFDDSNINNVIIGNNEMALNSCLSRALKLNYTSFIITSCLEGEAREVARAFATLSKLLTLDCTATYDSVVLSHAFKTSPGCIDQIIVQSRQTLLNGGSVCLLSGGETTVVLNPNFAGRGGRNQEMALAFSLEIKDVNFDQHSLCFGSMGTDGIDGNNDSAGAIAYNGQASLAVQDGLDPITYLDRNDSYHFFRKFQNGKDHIIIGHTGTNVMDLQILLIGSNSI